MTDDERAQWARTRPAVASHAIDLMEREIFELRRLAWDSAEIAEREIATLEYFVQHCISSEEQEQDMARWDDAARRELLRRDATLREKVAALEAECDQLRLHVMDLEHKNGMLRVDAHVREGIE